jgi:hypothetical protein
MANMGRKIIVKTIEGYARKTQNWSLLNLLDRIQNPEVAPVRQQQVVPRPPKLPPDERDYRSIVDVLEKNGRNVSLAVLGSVRRRWLERQPRDPNSPNKTHLHDVLARMVQDGVLAKQGTRYVPGPNYARYLGTGAVAAVTEHSATMQRLSDLLRQPIPE